MPIIETEKWTPSPNNPNRRVYAGQRTAQEVFNDLEAHLKSIGYLPEDYFNFDCHGNWAHGREFPEDGWLTTQVDYGGSEGIYLDVTLEYNENGQNKHDHFATGKTLGESGSDMDRMHLIASAITRAFHEDGLHARFVMVGGGEPAPEGITVNFSPEERRVTAEGLARLREDLDPEQADHLLIGQLLKRLGYEDIGQEQAVVIGPDNIRISQELMIEDGYINAAIETWFDVDARFGTETADTADWINLYADYYPEDGRLEAYYTLWRNQGDDESFPVELADEETQAILEAMREAGLDDAVQEMNADPGMTM